MSETTPSDGAIVKSSNAPMQMLDGEGQFVDELADNFKDRGFYDRDCDYYLVAILGCQSSGKSTLLNGLFDTDFEVMNASKGRTQTTVGVWVSLSENVLVMDVEGTDSRERGEDHGAFERKTSLLSLALSEVLLINMWAHDVGRHEGANYSLLKIVFELNLQLFQSNKSKKQLIVFVLRDFDGETGLDKLEATIAEDMDNIWAGMAKPDEQASSKPTDFFEYRYFSLPHKKWAAAEFNSRVKELRRMFVDKTSDKYVLGPDYKNDVPADGLPRYAKGIWETIQANKDLNLPSQKEMLAIYRCDEISANAYKTFEEELVTLKEPLKTQDTIPNFGTTASVLVEKVVQEYDKLAKRYLSEISNKKREDLLAKMDGALKPIYDNQIASLVGIAKQKFLERFRDKLPSKEPCKDFVNVADALVQEARESFVTSASASLIKLFDWDFKQRLQELELFMKDAVDKERDNQLTLLIENAKSAISRGLGRRLGVLFEKAKGNMWTQVRKLYSAKKDDLVQTILNNLTESFRVDEKELASKREEIEQLVFKVLSKIVREKASNLLLFMDRSFNAHFRLDDSGIPKRWLPTDDVSTYYIKAKSMTETMLDALSIIRLEEEDDELTYFSKVGQRLVVVDDPPTVDEVKEVLSPDDCRHLLESFRSHAEATYREALREQENAKSRASIPIYMIVLLVVLGWNEIWSVLTSPLYFVLVAGLGGTTVVLYQLGILKALEPVARAAANQGYVMGKEYIRNTLNNQMQTTKAKDD